MTREATAFGVPITILDDSTIKMTCPACGGSLARVKDSRPAAFTKTGSFFVRRKRECVACGHFEFTLEISESSFQDVVDAASSELVKERFRRAVMKAVADIE